MALALEFCEITTPTGYQGRVNYIRIETSTKKRWCRGCNNPILKGTRHVSMDCHLSSGRRSDIRLCQACISKAQKEVSR